MELEIKKRVDDYLGFDSDRLFKSCDLVRIFGGAIRDSICGDPINDIDILVGSKSIRMVEHILSLHGYTLIESLIPKDLASVYNDIQVISEPHTWMNGNKIVQLIRPRITQPNYKTGGGLVMNPDTYTYKENFNVLISNVDLSCCGVSYSGNKVSEDYPNAILHCRSKVFSVNQNAKMYSHKRIHHRIAKLEGRGWSRIDDTVSVNRDLKIDYLNKSI
jgi:hypothetical protein